MRFSRCPAIADCQVGGGTAWFLGQTRRRVFASTCCLSTKPRKCRWQTCLAVSQAAESIVLLGDPRQLEQPIQGSHPDGVDVSALDHILGPHATVPPDRGLFLAETWRLHPLICAFNSELFYESRLNPRPGLESQAIKSSGRLNGAGLRYLPSSIRAIKAHRGRRPTPSAILSPKYWDPARPGSIDRAPSPPVALEDILIIAPYNAQVFELQERTAGARIGTVDKFQGQEAPIVIYSMTTSSHSDAPRGMEFLYSSNRLNVATSRAKCICVVVASPRLFEPECRTPRQMQLANAFCRYSELAIWL